MTRKHAQGIADEELQALEQTSELRNPPGRVMGWSLHDSIGAIVEDDRAIGKLGNSIGTLIASTLMITYDIKPGKHGIPGQRLRNWQ